jgi:hypothetical protein
MRQRCRPCGVVSYAVDCVVALLLCAALPGSVVLDAQARRTQPRPATPAARPAASAQTTEPAMVTCPQVLGDGVNSGTPYCDVLIGRDPAAGIIVTLPPHRGPVLLGFDLHNRQTYSEDEVKAKRAFRRYTATIGVLAMDNTLLARAVIRSEFRTAADLADRITGGVGPGGVKAVAPTGTEPVVIEIEAQAEQVSILGEKLHAVRSDGGEDTFTASGRPIAIISNVTVTYTPAPAKPKPPSPPPATRKPAARR